MLYPWQEADYASLMEAYLRRGFNALLIHGAANSAAGGLADELIQAILCQNLQNKIACRKCSACILFQENHHPDYYQLAPEVNDERKNPTIKVEQIRQLIDFANKSQHLSPVKLIYLPDANSLNLSSSNALLKILEEPPSQTLFILQAANINQILPTINSRCFKYQLALPDYAQALAYLQSQQLENGEFWLNYFGKEPLFNIPFTAKQLQLLESSLLKPSIDNIFNLTRELDPKKIGMAVWLDFLVKWLSDLSSLKLARRLSFFSHMVVPLQVLSERANFERLFSLFDEVVFLSSWSEHPLNHKLQLENILLKYQQIYV